MLSHGKGAEHAEKSSRDREVWSSIAVHRAPVLERAHFLLAQAEQQAMATLKALDIPAVDARMRPVEANDPDNTSTKTPPASPPPSEEILRQITAGMSDAEGLPDDNAHDAARQKAANAAESKAAVTVPDPAEAPFSSQLEQPRNNGLDKQKILEQIYAIYDNPGAFDEAE